MPIMLLCETFFSLRLVPTIKFINKMVLIIIFFSLDISVIANARKKWIKDLKGLRKYRYLIKILFVHIP